MTGSSRVVTMGRLPPKIQYCAFVAQMRAASETSLEIAVKAIECAFSEACERGAEPAERELT